MGKIFRLFFLVIPVFFTLCAVGFFDESIYRSVFREFFFRAGVSFSCAVIVCLASGQALRRTKWYVIAGLVVSVFGDWFMVNRGGNSTLFIYAIGLFFIAHVCFCSFCIVNGRIDKGVLLALLTGYLPFFFVELRPALTQTPLFAAVMAYLLVSCLSLSAAAGLRLPAVVRATYMLGIALFVFSDTIIALRSFTPYRGDLNSLILPTYFASHVVIALALMLMGIFFDSHSRSSQQNA
jgi:uncharacterized membrane protein YhhN